MLSACEIEENISNRGGGIFAMKGVMTVSECLIQNNKASSDGGGGGGGVDPNSPGGPTDPNSPGGPPL